jgi:hypothetical protein
MSHRLDRLELEVHTTSEALARQLQDRLSQLHQRVLAQLVGRVMDPFSPPGVVHRLESLELNLGEIPEEQLEQLLPQRLEQALREALTAQLPNALEGQDLELLSAYASRGRLPWWAARHNPQAIPEALEAALRRPAETLLAWWHQELADATARQRLLAAARPDQAARLRELLGDGLRPDPSPENALEPLSTDATSGRLPDGGSPPDARWIAAALEAALRLPPELLQAWWLQALPDATARQRLLAAAQPDQAARLLQLLGDGLRPDPSPANALELLSTDATTGRLPDGGSPPDARWIAAALEAALRLPPELLQAWWLQALPDATARQRLLAAAQPDQATRLRQLLGDGLRPDPSPENALEPLSTDATAGRLPEGSSPADASWIAATPPEALRLRQQQAATPEEPISVDGAGVVLLTPFLETLFDRLELLTPERQFHTPEAAQRAVALLDWLVEGDPHPPEWRLTLAKPLCGWALEQLWSLENPLSQTDQAEAKRLLLAALAHSEGLLGESIEQLRQSWLQRPALLSWRPEGWLLLVEQRKGDEILDQLPWSWAWIRMPWMGALLQVVW